VVTIQNLFATNSKVHNEKNCCFGGSISRKIRWPFIIILASVVNQCDLVREATTSWGIDGTRTTCRDEDAK
jgi:hypothetical protein